jgi:16S rRNA (cytosine1407-C5)-methyltransferase
MLHCAPELFPVVCPWLKTPYFFLNNSWRRCARRFLHLSLDDFIAACQRPLRRSIRVNTLKISVDDFLALVAPYSWQLTPVPWCAEGSGSSAMTKTPCRWEAPLNI